MKCIDDLQAVLFTGNQMTPVIDSIIRMFSGVGQRPHVGTIQNNMDKSDKSRRVESIQPFLTFGQGQKITHFQ